jgi:hypothetical protein
MAALNDFKTFMAAKLGQILQREIAPSEITLGTPSVPSNPAKRRLPIEYKGKFYPVIYEPFNIARLFGQNGIAMVTKVETVHQLIPGINAKYGIGLTAEDVLDGPLTEVTVIEIAPTSMQWSGTLTVNISEDTAVPIPLHHLPFEVDGRNLGTSAIPSTMVFDYVEFLGKKWGAAKKAEMQLIGPGIDIDMRGNFTLDFETIANPIGDVYGQLMSHSESGDVAQRGALSTWRNMGPTHINKPYLSSIGYSGPDTSLMPQLLADTPMRITITRTGSNWRWFQDGVLAWEFEATPNITSALKYWGTTTLRSKLYLRQLRYWDYALREAELRTLLNPLYNITKPLHEFLFNGNTKNTGTAGIDMTTPMTFGEAEGGTYAYLNSNVPVMFGNGLKMSVSGDYTYDFVVMYNTTPSGYYCLFNTSSGNNEAVGAFYFYYGKHYEYLVHPGSPGMVNADAPVVGKPYRITICSRGGRTKHYVNGKFAVEYASPAGGRVLDRWLAPSYGWPGNAGIGYVRMWDSGLSDAELAVLFAN